MHSTPKTTRHTKTSKVPKPQLDLIFAKKKMDVPFPIHIVHGGDIESLRPGDARLVLQARSLRNTLGVLKRRLRRMTGDKIHTLADVEHYKVCLRFFYPFGFGVWGVLDSCQGCSLMVATMP